mgnify:CR=1 FL=1
MLGRRWEGFGPNAPRNDEYMEFRLELLVIGMLCEVKGIIYRVLSLIVDSKIKRIIKNLLTDYVIQFQCTATGINLKTQN